MKRYICLALYYGIAQYLPDSYVPVFGKISNWIRIFLCKRIFLKTGNLSTINRRVFFGTGENVVIGDYSGIGSNTHLPSNILIGKNVMLSRHCFILERNHEFSRIDIPINEQGFRSCIQTVIEDDCWIGMNCLLTPGRHISKGTIIAMGSVLTKDFPEYSIVGGNPAKIIRSRLLKNGDKN